MKPAMLLRTGLLCVLLVGVEVSAQVTTGTLLGTVSDATGAVVPGASVNLKNVETGISRTVTTDESGRYRAPQLGLGDYEIRVEAGGFQPVVRSGITLTVGREAVVDFALQVGQVTEQITVTGEAPLIETTAAGVSGLVDEQTMRDLPLLGRSFSDLAGIQPGVVSNLPVVSTGFSSVYSGGGNVSRRSISGTKPQLSTYLLDGIELTTPSRGMPVNSVLGEQLGVDAIREFTLLQNNYGAQYGRAAGGVINSVTQSGTNTLHGGVFEFFRNNALDARDYFLSRTLPKAPIKRNQFGGFLGGPIRKDRTFFFGNYEGLWVSAGEPDLGTTVQPEVWDGKIYNCPAGKTSCTREEALALAPARTVAAVNPDIKGAFQPILPLPNGNYRNNGAADVSGVYPWKAHENYLIGRVDEQLSSNDSLFGRLTMDRSTRTDQLALPLPQGFMAHQDGAYWVAALSWTRVISATVLNTARIGFTRRADKFFYNYTRGGDQFPNPNPPLDPRLSPVKGVPLGVYTIPNVTILGGVGPGISGPGTFFDNTFDYDDSININRGAHAIILGANFKRYQTNGVSSDAWAHGGPLSWQTIDNFLTNVTQTTTQLIGLSNPATQMPDTIRGWRQSYGAAYIQDDYRVRPNLTVNLGLRWEGVRAPREVNGKLAILKNLYTDSGLTRLTSTDPYFKLRDGLKGFSPRIGFAWTPFDNAKTAFRGGFGAFKEIPLGYLFLTANGVPGLSERLTVTPPKWPYPFADLSIISTVGEPLLIDNNYKISYTMQWTFSAERQIGETWVAKVIYIGLRGLNQFGQSNPNQPFTQADANGRQFTPLGSPVPNPNFTSIRYYTSFGDQYYNSAQFLVEKRYRQGLRFNVSYTLARNIDSTAASSRGAENLSGQPSLVYNTYDLGGEKGLSPFHIKHNFIASYTYELPLGSGRHWGSNWKGVPDAVLGGWTINGSTSLRTGLPSTVTLSPRQSRCVAQQCAERPDLISGGNNNPVLDNWTPERYFDTSQFVVQPTGYFGNLGRNTLIQPGLASMNFSVAKENRIAEGKKLEFRAEFFNLFNHPNFGPANVSVFTTATGTLNPSAGRITTTSTKMRQIQLGLKLTF